MNDVIMIDEQEYEVVPDEARVLTDYLFDLQKKLGISTDLIVDDMNKWSWQFVMEIYKAWAVAFPQEHRDFIDSTDFFLRYERPVQEAIKSGGYTPIAYPVRFHNLITVFLPKLKLQDKRFIRGMLSRIPELTRSNY